ncbi:sulfite exporter TauE/SafE family protein [Lacrimispora indolis]|uniref:sulfite exporter TauE/SafE family protein n=1 Tax=Lacrimispora indolis TaxID=69825 RepID=UPI0004625604|nr:sulfite exporter TauE/SafE family protein [[Clostridium] methoxybenzovorans]
MSGYLYVLFFAASFFSTVAGTVCGIGGGVIIKPVLDSFGLMSASSVSFLSGCTVLGMSCCSFVKCKISGDSPVSGKIGLPLAVGAALGGVFGKMMFQSMSDVFTDKNMIGAVQAVCLLVFTVGTLIYTLIKERISTHQIENRVSCLMVGLILGVVSSFLGIGGGPINLVVLFYFFSMETKVAAHNSLYIIMFSQFAGLISTLVTGSVPEFPFLLMVLMVTGGVLGGVGGRSINNKMSADDVDKIFIALMIVIIGINVYNIVKFLK